MSVSELSTERPGAEFDRLPPQDIVAEQCVLGGMLLSKDAIADVVEQIKGVDFYRPAHEVVFEVILDLYGRGEPADAVTVAAELTRRGEIGRMGGAPYLHTLIASVPTAANAGYYARIVREQAILRRLVEAGTRITQLGYAGDGEVDEVVDRAQAEIYAVTERRMSEDYQPLSAIMQGTLDEIEAIDSHDGTLIGVPTGFADLDSVTNGLHAGQMIIVAGRPAMGKALALDTPLPTPTGWTTMGDVQVGDELLDARGRPTRVVAATDVLLDRPCYRVTFSDHTTVVADADHQWVTTTRADRRAAAARSAGSRGEPALGVRTTAEIAATLRCVTSDRRLNHAVPLASPLQLPERALLVPPYVLGAWLGDGATATARITTADPEVLVHLESEGLVLTPVGQLGYGMALPPTPPLDRRPCVVCGRLFTPKSSQVRSCGRSCGGRSRGLLPSAPEPTCNLCHGPCAGGTLCMACRTAFGSLQARLRTIGVLGNKHIPAEYLRASEAQRRDVLAGLLDTDGTVARTGEIQITVTNERLASDIRDLVVGLGYRCMFRRKAVRGHTPESSVAYTIGFGADDPVFRLSRKQLAHKERDVRQFTRRDTRFITAVEPVESVPVRCVQVDNPDRLYLATRSMVPTHNSTLALDVTRSASIKHGMTSVIFSLEMSRNEITMRLLSAEAKVPLHKMRSGGLSDDDWTRLARRMGEVSGAPLFIDDSPNMSMMEIRAKCRRLKQRHDLRLIVVDYLQLMTSGKRVENRQVEVSEFSRSMKLLAKELEVPVIAVSQLNRGAEQRTDKRPMLSDLRESGSLEQDADMVILLHREEVYEKESPRAGEADLILAKHRNGPTHSGITVAFQGHYSRFVDMAHG
jgi:replicative DNA helicase